MKRNLQKDKTEKERKNIASTKGNFHSTLNSFTSQKASGIKLLALKVKTIRDSKGKKSSHLMCSTLLKKEHKHNNNTRERKSVRTRLGYHHLHPIQLYRTGVITLLQCICSCLPIQQQKKIFQATAKIYQTRACYCASKMI